MLTLKTEKQLKNLGLNSYEVKIWAALLSRGVSTVGKLSDIANVPRSRSYDVLKSLEKKGFVNSKTGKPLEYKAVSPGEATGRVKKRIVDVAKEEINKLNNLKNNNVVKELNALYEQGFEFINSVDLSGSLKGRHNLYDYTARMLKKAEKYVLMSVTQNEFINLVEQFKPILEKSKRKNINIKIFTQVNNQTRKHIGKINQLAEVRHTDNKARFCIVDGKEIIFMVMDDNEVHPTYDVGIWVNTPLARDLEEALNSQC